MPYTLKELGMWLDLGALQRANSNRKILSHLTNFSLRVLKLEVKVTVHVPDV
jgi:hypothetical protein